MSDITFELFETEFDESSVLECKFGQYIVGEKGDKGDKGDQGDEGSLTPDDTALLAAYTAAAANSASNAKTSEQNAATSAGQAQTAATSASNSANAANVSQTAASASASAASSSATAANTSANSASSSATAATNSANTAKDWATKTPGMVDGVDYSAKYYAQQTVSYANAAAGSASAAADSASAAAGSAAAAAGSAQDAANAAASVDTSTFVAIDGSRAMTAPLKTTGLALQGNSARITGDFSNATIALRTCIQSNVANGPTAVPVIPNGLGTQASVSCFSSSDPTNCAQLQMYVSATEARVFSTSYGSGSMLPLSFYTSGTLRYTISAAGAHSFSGPVTMSGNLSLVAYQANVGSIEIGAPNSVSVPFIDFHSSGKGTDFDARIFGSGGTATGGQGALNYSANAHYFTGDITLAQSASPTYSYQVLFKAGSYGPIVRGNNTGGIEFINSANNALNMSISDTGNFTVARGMATFQGPFNNFYNGCPVYINAQAGSYAAIGFGAKNGATGYQLRFNGDSNALECVVWNGATFGPIGASAFNVGSDAAIKTNVTPLTDVLPMLRDKRAVRYTIKEDETQTPQIGVISQEWEGDFPELISEGSTINLDGEMLVLDSDEERAGLIEGKLIRPMLMFNYGSSAAVALAGVIELDRALSAALDRIAALEQRLAALEGAAPA